MNQRDNVGRTQMWEGGTSAKLGGGRDEVQVFLGETMRLAEAWLV